MPFNVEPERSHGRPLRHPIALWATDSSIVQVTCCTAGFSENPQQDRQMGLLSVGEDEQPVGAQAAFRIPYTVYRIPIAQRWVSDG